MFGVVPRVVWERLRAPDDRHRIELAMNVLLIQDGVRNTLVDTGAGGKGDAKFRANYRLSTPSPEEFLRPAGLTPEQIDRVVLSHLHFDHCGGSTEPDGAGGFRSAFPRAEFFVQRGEIGFAALSNPRTRASYRCDDWEPLRTEGRLRLVEGETEIDGGVRLVPAPGHTPFHQIVRVETPERSVTFLADLVPTASHVPEAWVMGYDVEPLAAVASKRRLLPDAARRGSWVVFEHDAELPLGVLEEVDGRLAARPVPLEV
jgi:glyoxylase-like metal-dependent hydrolase (beta-lactamase superfamily II)